MKILRLTRHSASPEQVAALTAIYPGAEIIQVSETVPDAARVSELVQEHGADVLEAVLPLPLLADLLGLRGATTTSLTIRGVKIPIIRAVMIQRLNTDGSTSFEFSHYERIIRIVVETERLDPVLV